FSNLPLPVPPERRLMTMSDLERRREALAERLKAAGTGTDAPARRRRGPAATEEQIALLEKVVRRSLGRQADLQAALGRLGEEVFVLGKRLRKTESGLRALLRREIEALSGGSDPLDLDAQRFGLLSQN